MVVSVVMVLVLLMMVLVNSDGGFGDIDGSVSDVGNGYQLLENSIKSWLARGLKNLDHSQFQEELKTRPMFNQCFDQRS